MEDKCIKCQGRDGKFLFEWNLALHTIGIVRKDMFCHSRLYSDKVHGSFQIGLSTLFRQLF
mgnify:CR=1 FL=1